MDVYGRKKVGGSLGQASRIEGHLRYHERKCSEEGKRDGGVFVTLNIPFPGLARSVLTYRGRA